MTTKKSPQECRCELDEFLGATLAENCEIHNPRPHICVAGKTCEETPQEKEPKIQFTKEAMFVNGVRVKDYSKKAPQEKEILEKIGFGREQRIRDFANENSDFHTQNPISFKEQIIKDFIDSELATEPRTGDISAWINSVKASVYYPYFAQQEREKILKEFETGKLKQCDCCGKVKGEEFICGTCSDCI